MLCYFHLEMDPHLLTHVRYVQTTTVSVFVPGNLPRGLPVVDDCGGARRDQELDGETRGTQLDRFGPQCV